ncbi:MAG TPA: hypothetical protein PLE06_09625 [Thiobacillus sp.]|nr:MAG: hypothetical protein B7Y27_12415 [Hydrogenophilales bacterium 16-64-40]HQT34287.1 hypothetical protein [Thiobacillus sp.]
MYTPSHLLLRSGIFYFRIAVPNRLRPAFSGRTEFCFSLGTRDKKTALQKVWFLSLQTQRIWTAGEALLMAMKQDPNRLSFLLKYSSKEGLYVETDPNNPEDGAQALAAIQHLAPVIAAAEQSRPLIDGAEMLRLMHATNALSGIQSGPNSSRSLSAVLEDHMKVNATKWVPRTADDYRSSIELFIRTVGDVPIQIVVKRTVADFKVAMSGTMAASTLDKKLDTDATLHISAHRFVRPSRVLNAACDRELPCWIT